MAALGDALDQQRQQCIDVLCAYLRLPSDPNAGLLNAIAVARALPADSDQQPG